MATADDRTLKILLQLKADIADSSKVTGALKQVEAQAIRTNAAVKASSASSGLDAETIAREAAFAERLRKRLELRQAEEVQIKANAAASAAANVVAVQGAEQLERGTRGSGLGLLAVATLAFQVYQGISRAADETVRLATETARQSEELFKQVQRWQDLAAAAGDFADVLKLGEDIGPRLDAMATKLDEFRRRELDGWQIVQDAITRAFGSGIPGFGPRFNRDQLDASTNAQERSTKIALASANASIDAAQKAKAAWEAVNLLPLNEAIEQYTTKLDALRAKQAGIDRNASIPQFEEWVRVGKEIELAEKRVDQLTKSQTKLSTETDRVAAGIAKVDFGGLDKGEQLAELEAKLEDIRSKLNEVGIEAESPHDALEKSKDLTAATREEVIKLAGAWAAVLGEIVKVETAQAEDRRKAEEKAINDALSERAALMRRIRQEQRDVSGNPFLSIADKNAQLIPLLLEEAAAHEKAGEAAEGHAKKMEALALTFSGDLRANITAWANSFGTSAQQIGGFITGSINEALQSTNQLLVDAVFQTGDWRQTVVGLEKSILNMFLTMIEKMILQHVIGETQKGISTATSVAQGAAVATAQAPAAAATSISSFGSSAVVGSALAIAAIAAIIAALSGGFKKGGYVGDGGEDEIAGVVHGGEFVFSKKATSNIGIERLALMHRAAQAPHFLDGGPVEPPRIVPPYYGGYTNWPQNDYTRPYPWWDPPPQSWGNPGPVNSHSPTYWSGNNVVGPHLYGPGGSPFDPGGPYYSQFSGGIIYRDPVTGQFVHAGAGAIPPTAVGGEAYYQDPRTGLWTRIDPNFPGANPPSLTITIPPGVSGDVGGRASFSGYDTATGEAIYADAQGHLYTSRGTPARPGVTVRRATAVIPSTRPGGGAPPSSRDRLLTPGQYYQQTFGGLRGVGFRDPRGSAIGNSIENWRNANAMEMGDQARHQPTNLYQPDERMGWGPGMSGRIDKLGVYHQTGNISGIYNPEAFRQFVYGSQHRDTRTIPHGADGMRLPGAPSRTDTILAWLAAGEHVIPANTVAGLDQRFGRDWPDRLASMSFDVPRAPHFAAGGRAGSSSGSSTRSAPAMVKVINVIDMKAATREALRDPAARVIIVDHVKGSAHELALPAVNG